MVLRAVGFHHHTVDTLEIRTRDQPRMQQVAEHTGRLLTNNTRGDIMGLKRWSTRGRYNTSPNPVLLLLNIPANVTSAKTIKNCTGFDLSQFSLWRVRMSQLCVLPLILAKYLKFPQKPYTRFNLVVQLEEKGWFPLKPLSHVNEQEWGLTKSQSSWIYVPCYYYWICDWKSVQFSRMYKTRSVGWFQLHRWRLPDAAGTTTRRGQDPGGGPLRNVVVNLGP